jgi:Cu2+-exporting ATPase
MTEERDEAITSCQHCKSELTKSQRQSGFCCHGCKIAFQFIHSSHLEAFYSLIKKNEIGRAQSDREDSFIELYDDEQFCRNFVTIGEENQRSAKLFIDGLSCYACSWLIRNAVEKHFPNVKVDLSLSSGQAEILLPLGTKLSSLVQLIQKLGYGVKPAHDRQELRFSQDLVRIGVNAFCFLNIMMLALPDYVDANLIKEWHFWQLFRWLSLALTSVVITYGAMPFYRTSWIYAKNRRLSVDQPIVFALLLTYVYSTVNTILANGDVYFDSIAIVVTLLLSGRYLQMRMQQKAERLIRGKYDHSIQYVKRLVSGTKVIVPIAKLKEGQDFYLLPGDPLPVDAKIIQGHSEIHYEQITGESEPLEVRQGQILRAGAVNLGGRLDLIALQDGVSSFLAKINSLLGRMLLERGSYTKISDRLGSFFFVFIMLLASIILWTQWAHSPAEAIRRTVAALLIACPCAFAIAVPLAMTMCTAVAMRNGVVIKTQRAIETLGRVKQIFFDKTGTLTQGLPSVTQVYVDQTQLSDLNLTRTHLTSVLAQLDSISSHHAALALSSWAELESKPSRLSVTLRDAKEEFGKGLAFETPIEGLGSLPWRIGSYSFCFPLDPGAKSITGTSPTPIPEATIYISIANHSIAAVTLEDQLLPDAASTIEQLRDFRIRLGILSGDHNQRTLELARKLNIPAIDVFAEQSPTDKAKMLSDPINNSILTAMVGNGFNDSLALAQAAVGIAVADASQQAKDSAEVCLMTPGLGKLLEAFLISRTALRKIRYSFIFASVYNIIGLSLAASGKINPAVAAALMPVSSLIVILIATRGWTSRS